MKIRDLVISFGFEIDKNAESKVNDSIEDLKSFANKTLSTNPVGFDIDEQSKRQVENSINDLEKSTEPLGKTSVAYNINKPSEQKAINSINHIRNTAIRLLGVIGIGFSLVQMTRLSEEFGSINDQIKHATRGMGNQHELQQRILKAANDTRQDYATMANTINRLSMANTFDNIEDASHFATLMAQDFAAAGQSQEQSAQLTRYITMDLQKGAMSTQTFTAALRDSPHIINRIANSLNITTEQLQYMVKRGEISADILKDSFLNSADEINARFAQTDMTISDAIRNVRNSWGLFVSQMNDTLGISKIVARGIVNGFNQVMFVLRRATGILEKLTKHIGGIQNLMKLLAIAAAGILIALKGPVILHFFSQLGRAILSVSKKKLALVAGFILIALLIEDFLAFMRGDNSLIGEMFNKFGIDSNEVREIIFELWDAVKGVIPFIIELAKAFGGLLLEALQMILPLFINLIRQILPPLIDFIRRLLPMIFSVIERILPMLINLIGQLLPFIMQIIEAILPVLIKLIETLLPVILQIIEEVLPIVINLIEMLISIMMPIIENILPILMTILQSLIPVITFVAELLGDVLGAAFEGLMPIIDAIIKVFGGLIDFITGVFTGDWSKAWEGIKAIFSGIWSAMFELFKLPINLIITGLNVFIRGLNKISIPDWVPAVGGKGINIPEIPKLAKGSDFSPDTFIAGEEGPELITNAKGSKVFTAQETADTLGKLNVMSSINPLQFIEDLMRLIAVPVQDVAIPSNIETKHITQYNEFYNEFHGDRAGQEQSDKAMNKASDDAIGQLARALAYVR